MFAFQAQELGRGPAHRRALKIQLDAPCHHIYIFFV